MQKNNVHAGMILTPLHERYCLRVYNIRMRRFISDVTARNLMFTYWKIAFALKVTCPLTTRPCQDECMRYKNTHIRGLQTRVNSWKDTAPAWFRMLAAWQNHGYVCANNVNVWKKLFACKNNYCFRVFTRCLRLLFQRCRNKNWRIRMFSRRQRWIVQRTRM